MVYTCLQVVRDLGLRHPHLPSTTSLNFSAGNAANQLAELALALERHCMGALLDFLNEDGLMARLKTRLRLPFAAQEQIQ